MSEVIAHAVNIANNEGCDTTKNGVIEALTRKGSFDVQACPGAGKTTVVATKLAILLDRWTQSGGICTLTHTNVARDEIRRKLRFSVAGSAALSSPHFVGTIQSFIDSFLALPYLRAKGLPLEQIDNDAFASVADQEYGRGYHKLKFWFKQRAAHVSEMQYRLLEYSSDGKLTFGGKPTGLVDPESASYQELLGLKSALTERGVFRYGDMYHFATRYLDEFSWAVDALRARFKMLIIDEMQDTSARQEALLNRIFAPDVMDVQRFGDENQKIFDMDFSDDEPTSFPRDPVINLGESMRFGTFIASHLATIAPRKQVILGDSKVTSGRHTILLCDEVTASNVIPRFAEIAADELKDLDETPVVKVVGHRKRASNDGGKFPNHLGDFVPGFVVDAVASITGPEGLRLRVERAKAAGISDSFVSSEQMLTSVRILCRLWGSQERPQSIISKIRQNREQRRRFGEVILKLLGTDAGDEKVWNKLIGPLFKVLKEVIGFDAAPAAISFAKWVPVEVSLGTQQSSTPARLAIHVDVGTIHSVKGESHHATLVLETQYNQHDVPLILRYLTDARYRKKALGVQAVMHHRRMFVAMSRPRRLLCMAAAAAHVDEPTRLELKALGWTVEDLTAEL